MDSNSGVTTRRHDIQGLTFVPVRIDPSRAVELANFAFVRVARGMPTLRPISPSLLRTDTSFPVDLPASGPLSNEFRAVIFDGGIPPEARQALSPWLSLIEPDGIGPAVSGYEDHGLAVSSAFLFGALREGAAEQPLCHVDHVRVLDDATGDDGIECYDVLDRIVKHLDQTSGLYEFGNTSLGPCLAVEDDEVTLWTAALDTRFSNGRILATVAAGNSGHLPSDGGLNRVQPPADGVNVLSIGAADSPEPSWARARYSCVGPGRCPGVVKPDLVAFGGSDRSGFGVLDRGLRGHYQQGTSIAAPLALRAAVAVRVQLGASQVSSLATRALLIHTAKSAGHDWREVGWGRLETDSVRLITCDDDEALIVYQGELPVGEHLRVRVPTPADAMEGFVWVSATLVISPEVDPEHPSAYTRSGLQVAFRPHSQRFSKPVDGRAPNHAKTKAFFSERLLYGASESVLREDGNKWEPCLSGRVRLRPTSLFEPCFDIYYHTREAGMTARDPQRIPYSLIVGLHARRVPDLYDRVVRAYANVLIPLRPQTRVQIQP